MRFKNGEFILPFSFLCSADNVTTDAASVGDGATFKTDDDGTAHWPYVKVAFGADNTQSIVSSTATNPLPVALSDTDNAVLDTIDAVLDTINAKLVTGTVIGDVNLGATDNAVLDSIDSAVNGTLTVGSHAVTNAGTFAVQISDSSFAVADGNALGEGVLIQGDDGTDRKNINVDATTGDVQVDVTNTVTVDATGQGDVPITLAGEAVVLGAGTAGIGKLTANDGVDIGDVDVTSISAGTNLIGDVGLSGARASGGTTFTSSLGTSTLTQIKATAGQLYWLHVINLKASVLYLQIFDLASASVTLGTTPPDLVFPLVTQGDTNGAGFVLSVPNGIAFGTGISWAITTTETGATTASDNEAYLNAGYA